MTKRMETTVTELVERLKALARPSHLEKLPRFGIAADRAFGVPVPLIRDLARACRTRHDLALPLWDTGWHEARLLAPMIADPRATTPTLVDRWTEQFDSWDVCDLCCMNLFRRLPFAFDKVREYAGRDEEFVRRTAFALMATLATGDKKAGDERFMAFFDLIEAASTDPRNFVRKAVDWALRQTGKRNLRLHAAALDVSRRLAGSSDKTASCTGRNALRELSDPKIVARIKP